MLKQRQTEDWTDLWHKDKVKGLFTTYEHFGMEHMCITFWNVAMDKLLKASDLIYEVVPGLLTTLTFRSTSPNYSNFKEPFSSLKPSKPNTIIILIFFQIYFKDPRNAWWHLNGATSQPLNFLLLIIKKMFCLWKEKECCYHVITEKLISFTFCSKLILWPQ